MSARFPCPLVVLLFAVALCAGAVAPARSVNVLNFCTEQNQPVFIFQNLWTDSAESAQRKHELWVDQDKDLIRAFWWPIGGRPKFLIGSQLSKTDFYLCEYAWHEKTPTGAFVGQFRANGMRLEAADGKRTAAFDFIYRPVLAENRSYSLKYENRSVKFQIQGKIPKDRPFTCEATVGSFQLVGSPASKVVEGTNKKLTELAQAINWDKESEDCQKIQSPPSAKTISLNLMFASDRFLSAKLDFVQIRAGGGDLQGKTLNLDLTTQTVLNWNEIVRPADQDIILRELNRRINLIYGEKAKYGSLKGSSFSFNGQTLVVSGTPQWVMDDRVDIPIPLDHLFEVLEIRRIGPFSAR